MEELTVFQDYQEYKRVMDAEIGEAAAGFVRIGYLLKMARDNNIVQQAGYADVNEFAKANYGLTRDMVSRYIDINDKYSENGNSMQLQEKYRGFGYSKLAEMLTLPDAIADEMQPSTTREEIREIKRELKAEQAISDIEVMCETPELRTEVICETNLEKTVFALLEEKKELYEALYKALDDEEDEEEKAKIVYDILAPNEAAVHTARVPQVGRMMLSIRDKASKIQLVNMRSGEREEYFMSDLILAIENTWPMQSCSAEDAYRQVYDKPMHEEIAPAQQPEKTESEQKAAAVEESKDNLQEVKENAQISEKKSQEVAENVREIENNVQEIEKDARNEAPVEQCTDNVAQNIMPEPIETEKVHGSVVSIIEKKILPEYFRHIMNGSKTFEIRKDEDGIQPGDTLILKEWDEELKRYSGRQEEVTITYVLRDAEKFGLMPGYCIMCWGN